MKEKTGLKHVLLWLLPFWLLPVLITVDTLTGSYFERTMNWMQMLPAPLSWIAMFMQMMLLVFVIYFGFFLGPATLVVSVLLPLAWRVRSSFSLASGAALLAFLAPFGLWLLQVRLAGTHINRDFWQNQFLGYFQTPYALIPVISALAIGFMVFHYHRRQHLPAVESVQLRQDPPTN